MSVLVGDWVKGLNVCVCVLTVCGWGGVKVRGCEFGMEIRNISVSV